MGRTIPILMIVIRKKTRPKSKLKSNFSKRQILNLTPPHMRGQQLGGMKSGSLSRFAKSRCRPLNHITLKRPNWVSKRSRKMD